MLPFDLDHVPPTAWPEALRPIGESTHAKETFDAWWERNRQGLAHLPEDLCEQWIYRHWTHSPFSFLPLDGLALERRFWSGDELLVSVHPAPGAASCTPSSTMTPPATWRRGSPPDGCRAR